MARAKKVATSPLEVQIAALRDEIIESGEPGIPDLLHFKDWVRRHAEQELWFFSRWILGHDHLSLGTFHRREVGPFLTDFSKGRFKLLMLPMGHLKTTIVTRTLPIHALIQPIANNIYFSGVSGQNLRILLANENEQKSKENLQYVSNHLMNNPLLKWLWPTVVWEDHKDAKAAGARWTDFQVDVKRTQIYAEPSIQAVGIKTGFIGKYFDIILPDDICGPEAAQNPPLMERAKYWRKAVRTRFSDKKRGIMIGVGTHWGSEDVYVEWKKDPAVDVMIRAVLEPTGINKDGPDAPLWPEKFPMDIIEGIRVGMDPITFALWYLNKPVPSGYTALRWEDLREFTVTDGGRTLVFADSLADERIAKRFETKARNLGFKLMTRYDPAMARRREKKPKDMDAEFFEYIQYKHAERIPLTDDEQARVNGGEDLRAVLFGGRGDAP